MFKIRLFIFFLFLNFYYLNTVNSSVLDPLMIENSFKDNISIDRKYINSICNNIKQDQELQLSDLINISLCNNQKIKEGWYNFVRNQENLGIGYSSYLPNIKASTGFNYIDFKTNNFGPFFPSHGTGNSLMTSISLDYLIYDFGARSSKIEMLKNNLIAAGYQYNSLIQDTIFNVIQRYYNYLSIKELLDSKKKNEELSRISYEYSKTRRINGISKKLDELQSNASYSNAKYERINTEKSLEIALVDLIISLGLNPATKINIKIENDIFNKGKIEELSNNINELIKIAKENNPKIKSSHANLIASKAKLEQSKYDGLPKIFASGSWNRNDIFNSSGFSGIGGGAYGGNKYIEYGMIGVTVSVPLFSGFRDWYSIRATKAEHEANISKVESLENEIILEVLRAQNNFEISIQNLLLTEELLIVAKEAEENAREGYKNGSNTILEVLAAQSNLSITEEKNIISRYNNHISRIALLKVLGTMPINY